MIQHKVKHINNNLWESSEGGDWLYSNEVTGTMVTKNSYETITNLMEDLKTCNNIENIVLLENTKVLLVKDC